MSLFITQCPHCHTSFRTSVSQLQSADGMVRCGACLRVFAADDNLLPSVDLRTVNIPVRDELEEDDDFESLDEQLPISELDVQDDSSEYDDNADKVFTLDMADSVPNRIDPSASTKEPTWHLVDEVMAAEDVSSETNSQQHSVEHDKDIEEKFIETTHEKAATTRDKPDLHTPVPPVQRNHSAQIRSRMTAIDFDDELLNDNPDSKGFTRFSAAEIEGVSDTENPLELDWHEAPRRSGKTVILLLLCAVLVLGIAGQYLWFNRDSLSQNVRVRPILDGACAALRCELPPLVNISAIRSDTLVVRSHTEIANALSVNFQFRNDAPFAQPFPGLALRFMDADDSLVAQRRFAPEEYLPEGMANLRLMPPGSPVQVRLDILDPGSQAVNYELNFYANQAN